jgi:hypothetical protein
VQYITDEKSGKIIVRPSNKFIPQTKIKNIATEDDYYTKLIYDDRTYTEDPESDKKETQTLYHKIHCFCWSYFS